ncbi:hypothetical protein LUW77_23120 [Streptomyces radiopugnans]|nr:hypothetical protein LUW77_23120 [Streptomyces radiopugnans]
MLTMPRTIAAVQMPLVCGGGGSGAQPGTGPTGPAGPYPWPGWGAAPGHGPPYACPCP